MNTLVIMNVATEGPGTLGTFLESVGAKITTVKLYEGQPLPASTSGLDVVLCLGGPMNVYEEEAYPFLKEETAFLEKAVRAGISVLGICLGAQMIAKALGAPVVKSPQKEVGWKQVHLTEQGRRDPLLAGIPDTLEVLQFHWDMFHLPGGAELLATSEVCPHQAFRFANAIGLQFHVEATREMLSEWFRGYRGLEEILRRHAEIQAELSPLAERLYRNFLRLPS